MQGARVQADDEREDRWLVCTLTCDALALLAAAAATAAPSLAAFFASSAATSSAVSGMSSDCSKRDEEVIQQRAFISHRTHTAATCLNRQERLPRHAAVAQQHGDRHLVSIGITRLFRNDEDVIAVGVYERGNGS